MTDHGINSRGMKHYCIQNPESQTNPNFILSLRHSRIREALEGLIDAGTTGCTALERPAPRLASYVHRLRKLGVAIVTIREPHGGPFPGTHARYVLCSSVTVVRVRKEV
jgi:hypothetical protein